MQVKDFLTTQVSYALCQRLLVSCFRLMTHFFDKLRHAYLALMSMDTKLFSNIFIDTESHCAGQNKLYVYGIRAKVCNHTSTS